MRTDTLPSVPVTLPASPSPECGIAGCLFCLPDPDPSERVTLPLAERLAPYGPDRGAGRRDPVWRGLARVAWRRDVTRWA